MNDRTRAEEFERALADHDEALAGRGDGVWMGCEPTYTDRGSEHPAWLSRPLGSNKEQRARELLMRLAALHPGAAILRSQGRQYAGEETSRWNYGLYVRRDALPLWGGPPDPLLAGPESRPAALRAFRQALVEALNRDGWTARAFLASERAEYRLSLCPDGGTPWVDPIEEPRLARASIHALPADQAVTVDDLAADGQFLLSPELVALDGDDDVEQVCLELPGVIEVAVFNRLLKAVAAAARQAGLRSLVLRGFPPPVDDTVSWTTLTPDPAVLEVNLAPEPDARAFYRGLGEVFAAAGSIGLSAYRLHYNGSVTDSGGGGQFTFGGASPLASPFFRSPHLLPRLVRYLNHHPSLSYWFAVQYVGGASQSPRPDEGGLENFNELGVCLDRVERVARPQPEFLWRSFSSFLADMSGNPHRSELNIEKLWNPDLPVRGCLGLVEFRAFRMARSAEEATAMAVLLRALIAMLGDEDAVPDLKDWGSVLHDRYALPYYLREDLLVILTELEVHGLGLPEVLRGHLLDASWRTLRRLEFAGCVLQLEQALEFWPLVGDAASQEGEGSRTVDASTLRLQVSLRPLSGQPADLEPWSLMVDHFLLPLRAETDSSGPLRLLGVRYRNFVPARGLHPGIGAQGPLRFTLRRRGLQRALRVEVHDWRPDGLAYDGLPGDMAEATRRREQRVIVREIAAAELQAPMSPPVNAMSGYCLDLRRL